MENSKLLSGIPLKKLFFLMIGFIYFGGLDAAPEDVDVTGPNPNLEHEFLLGMEEIPAGTEFGVVNAVGNVFWEFASIPGSATGVTSTSFTINGITVTIPDTSGGAVSNSSTATIEGTPTDPGSFTFTVTVSDETDPASRTRNRPYALIISPAMDMVLVLDRSGSMGIETGAGVSRWQALKDAAANFLLVLTNLGRTGDNIGLTYFHSTVTQPSVVNFPSSLIPIDNSNIVNTVNSELNTQSPGGSTAMGAGMIDGQGKLTDDSRMRLIFLITDGEQNVSPEVNANGQGYSDGTSLNPSYPAGPGSIKVFTIGIDGPNGPDLDVLQNLAGENRGYYVGTEDGTLEEAFTDQLVNAMNSLSPQLLVRSSTTLNQRESSTTLQSFPLNKKVSRLLVKIKANRKFEVPQLIQFASAITLEKDGVPITSGVNPSWVGNYSNTILLTIPFNIPIIGGPPVTSPEGNWTVKIGATGELNISEVKVTSIADDHRLDYTYSYGATSPMVNTVLTPSVTVNWLGEPVTDADVQAIILRPGEDLGDFLANNPLTVNVSNDPDAPSPGVQKYNQLIRDDPNFKNSLDYNENVITLNHTSDGRYENTFDGLTVAGNYQIIYRISGDSPETGNFQRFATESFFTSFNGIDLDASNLSTDAIKNSLVINMKPVSTTGKLIGPAYGKGFTIDNSNVKINKIEDHQDGSYTLTFSGNIDEPVSFKLMGQEIYEGELSEIGQSGSVLDTIRDWLISIGLPAWSLWLILLIVIIIIFILGKWKNK